MVALDGATAMTLTQYLQVLGEIITKFFEWVVSALEVITSNSILLVPFGVIAVFTVIKLLKSIF